MSFYNTRLFIESQEIDLTDNFDGAITYSLNDIKDLGSVKGPYSKTIIVPGTRNNNIAFNYFFEGKVSKDFAVSGVPNIGVSYNFKKKARAYVMQDGMIILQGWARLAGASITDNQVEYSVELDSDLAGLFSDLGDSLIEDLVPTGSSSIFDHNVTLGNITNSWNISGSDQASASGTAYLYAIIDYGQFETTNGMNFYVQNLRPAIFAKTYWDLCFQSASYTYSSSLFTSSYFQSLVIPYAEGNIQNGNAFESLIGVSGSQGSSTITGSFSSSFTTGSTIFNFVISDPNNCYSASKQAYYATSSGVYNIDFELDYNLNLVVTGGTSGFVINTSMSLAYDVQRYNSAGVFLGNQTAVFRQYPTNAIQFTHSASLSESDKVSNINQFMNAGDYLTVSIAYLSQLPNSQLFAVGATPWVPVAGYAQAQINATTTFLQVELNSAFDGAVTTYFQYCLKNTKCTDYLSSIIALFDLFIVADKFIPRHFNVFTRDEYYQGQNQVVKDWSKKVDYKQKRDLQPIPNLDSRNLLFAYKQDTDFWNTYYTSLYGGLGYGSLQLNTGYQFNQDTKVVMGDSFIFAPMVPVMYPNGPNMAYQYNSEAPVEVSMTDKTIMSVSGYSSSIQQDSASLPGLTPLTKLRTGVPISYWGQQYFVGTCYNDFSFQLVNASGTPVTASRPPGQANSWYYATTDNFSYIPQNSKVICTSYNSSDNNVTRSPAKKAGPSILKYNGLVSCSQWVLQYTPTVVGTSFQYYTGNTGSVYYTKLNHYPLLHHLDSLTNPQSDLLWAEPEEVFFPINTYTTNSLFQNFWLNQTLEVTDSDAVLLTAQCQLNSIDIGELDFSNVIQIAGENYRINSINNYSPNPDQTTEVELLRLPYQIYKENPALITTTTTKAPVNFFVTASSGLTGGVSSVRTNGISITYVAGSNFTLNAGQSGSFLSPGNNISNASVAIDLSNGIIGEVLTLEGTDGIIHNNVLSATGAQTVTFTDVPMFPGGAASLLVTPTSPTTTTTTTTLPPGTMTFSICNSPQGPVSVTGFISVTGLVNTNVTVNFTVVDSTLASHTGSAVVSSGNSSTTWGSLIATSSSISSITINSLSPTSNAGQTFVIYGSGGWTGACGTTTSTTTTIAPTTTTTHSPTTIAPTTTTTIAPTTTTTTPAPTVNISNTRPGATISSVTGIAGFTSGVISSGGSVSGNHSSFSGNITVSFSTGPTSNCNLYLTGAQTQTISVAANFSGNKVFTSATYASTDTIDITLAP